MEKLERYLQFIREAERLKNVLRTAYTSEGRHESTAEHTWRLALLALVLADEKPELDLQRVLAMCLVHDLGEAYVRRHPGRRAVRPRRQSRCGTVGHGAAHAPAAR